MRRVDESSEFRQRLSAFSLAVAAAFGTLAVRLAWVQGVRGEDHRRRAEDNYLEERRVAALRGHIVDSRGRTLATNRPSFDVYVTPRFLGEDTLDRLVRLLRLSAEEADAVRERVRSRQGAAQHRPLRVVRDIDRDQLARVETERPPLPGVRVEAGTHRTYPAGGAAAHAVGFMNEATPAELGELRGDGYAAGDLIGRAGVERVFEPYLRGVPGRRPVIVDARGAAVAARAIGALGLGGRLAGAGRAEPRPGHTTVLTLDLDLQRAAERALRAQAAGAVVVVEAQTGRVLAAVSRPTFDPNAMTGRISREELLRIEKDPYRPLIDKTLREDYFPGSIYKVIPAIAGLEDRLIEPRERILCQGYHELGRRTFRCPHAHGLVDMEQAIVQSCNVYFYRLAERVGMDRMAEVARDFGLGAPAGLGMNGEAAGFVPTKAWYASSWKEGFRLGFTLQSAIGQGNVKVTVLQMALLYASLGNGGRLFVPQIMRRIETADGRLVQDFPPRLRRRVTVSDETLRFVTRALAGVVENPKGTAFEARPRDDIEVAGKTGTAQVRGRQAGQPDRDHAWFVAFAPVEEPQIAVAVMVEHGGQGAKVAAPIAMEVTRAYFRDQVVPLAASGFGEEIDAEAPGAAEPGPAPGPAAGAP